MLEYAVNIKGLSEEKLGELFDMLERFNEDVTRLNGVAFPHVTEPMVELGYDQANASWVMAPMGYFNHKKMLSPDEFIQVVEIKQY